MSDRDENFNLHVAKSKEPDVNSLLNMLRNQSVFQGYMIHLVKKHMAEIIRTEVAGLTDALSLAESIQKKQEKEMDEAFEVYAQQMKDHREELFDDESLIENLSKKTGVPKKLLRAELQKRYKGAKK